MILAGILFVVTYLLLLVLPKHRAAVSLLGAAAFVVSGALPPVEAPHAVDWNVLMMIAGTMGLVSLFAASGMPMRLADELLHRTSGVRTAGVALALFAGLVSAMIDNVATVLMIAPVALAVARQLKISPVPVLIAVSVSSNLQGAATLVGDTTSILLGSAAGMDFTDFFVYQGHPGIFWVVEIGALASALVLLVLFRKEKGRIESNLFTNVSDYFPTVLLLLMIALLASASFLPSKPALTNGLICLSLFVVGAVRAVFLEGKNAFKTSLLAIDLNTLEMLFGVFVIVGGVEQSGLLAEISNKLVYFGGGNLLLIYSLVVWGSVILSAFIDNIPYVAAMLPVTAGVSAALGIDPTLLYFGLLIGATLGGNLTPVGASANIAAIGFLRREGYSVSNRDFLRIGIPFTLSAVCTGYLLIWLIWA